MANVTFDKLPEVVNELRKEIQVLKEIIINNQTDQNNDEIIYAKDCAKLLGIKVTTLYTYTHKNKIPFSKTGKLLLFNRLEILDYIQTKKCKTQSKIESEVNTYLKGCA